MQKQHPLHKLTLALSVFFIGCVSTIDAAAGIVGGPLVVWINLSKDTTLIDHRIQSYLSSGDAERECGNFGMVLYMNKKPPEITVKLAKSALIDKEPKAIAEVNKLLRKPFRGATEGMDGILLYTDEPQPKFYSLTTGKRKVRELEVYPKEVETGMCVMLPTIVRKP